MGQEWQLSTGALLTILLHNRYHRRRIQDKKDAQLLLEAWLANALPPGSGLDAAIGPHGIRPAMLCMCQEYDHSSGMCRHLAQHAEVCAKVPREASALQVLTHVLADLHVQVLQLLGLGSLVQDMCAGGGRQGGRRNGCQAFGGSQEGSGASQDCRQGEEA